jgi:SAM-dependent methyltransferase
MNTISRELVRQGKDILDIGGGPGEPMAFLARKRRFRLRVNADTSLPDLKVAKKKGTHDEYVLCDGAYLPFKEKSFDIVLCLETIEHLGKENGLKMLPDLESIARKQVIITTEVRERIDPNMSEAIKVSPMCHHSSWCPGEFNKLKFKIRGHGFPPIKGYYLVRSTNALLAFLGYLIYPLASPFVYFFPNKAGGMTCIKYLTEAQRRSSKTHGKLH